MNNKSVKIIMVSFVLVFSMFLINVKGADAMGTPNGKGFAYCEYKLGQATGASTTQQRLFAIRVTVFKNTDGNYDGYAITGCGNVESTNANSTSKYSESRCKISNYSEMFNRNDLASHFTRDKKTWRCPTLYAKIGYTNTSVNTDVELSYKDNGRGWKKITQVTNLSSKKGKPTLKAGVYEGNQTDGVANSIDREKQAAGKEPQYNQSSSSDDELGPGIGKEELGCQLLDKGADGKTILDDLKTIFTIMQVAGIVILLLFSVWDFAKAITSSDDDRLKKVSKRFIFRLIAAAILLLLPVIIKMVLDIMHVAGVTQIGDFCIDQFL